MKWISTHEISIVRDIPLPDVDLSKLTRFQLSSSSPVGRIGTMWTRLRVLKKANHCFFHIFKNKISDLELDNSPECCREAGRTQADEDDDEDNGEDSP